MTGEKPKPTADPLNNPSEDNFLGDGRRAGEGNNELGSSEAGALIRVLTHFAARSK
jgi:hypothetical protein